MARDKLLVARVTDRFAQGRWDGKLIGKNARLQWDRNLFSLEELPQKGKKKLRKATLQNPSSHGDLDWFIPGNILNLAKISTSDDFDAIKKKIETSYKEAGQKSAESKYDRQRDAWEKNQKWVKQLKWYEEQVFYLEVVPEGVEPFTVEGKDFQMKVQWGNFEAYSPSSNFESHDPSYSVYEATSAGAGRKCYKTLKADPDQLKSVAWNSLTDWFKKNGIGYDIHHSVWH